MNIKDWTETFKGKIASRFVLCEKRVRCERCPFCDCTSEDLKRRHPMFVEWHLARIEIEELKSQLFEDDYALAPCREMLYDAMETRKLFTLHDIYVWHDAYLENKKKEENKED